MPIAIFQANPTMGAISDNVAALQAAAGAVPAGTTLLVAPELYVLGYPPDDLVKSPPVLAAVRAGLDHLAYALRQSVPVLVGAPVQDARGVVNAAVLVERGKWRVVAEKMTLPDDGVFDDPRVFAVGNGPGIIQVDGKSMGVMVCEDCWHEAPLEKLLANADTVIEKVMVINASPYERTKMGRRQETLRARVRRAGVPFLYVNLLGGQDEIVFDGGSFEMNPAGEITAQFPQFEEGIFYTGNQSLSLSLEGEGPTKWGERGVSGFKFLFKTEMVETRQPPSSGADAPPSPSREKGNFYKLSGLSEVYHAILMGTRDYVRKNGFSKVCLGLSGGVDSALVAVIAVDALGKENVTAMILPSEFSSAETQADARLQAEKLGIKIIEMPITAAHRGLEKDLAAAFGAPLNDITAQNLQSRLRGLALMALSNQTGALLLTTGNKSELAVGYATLYGDMNGGYNPIKDLYKTDVYPMCDWRNRHLPHSGAVASPILPSIIKRAPSAELRAGQTDQDTLPPYEFLDDILRALIEGNSAPELLARFDAAWVQKIQGWLDRNEYKRRQSAPGPKLTRKAFGRDRRWPMTHSLLQNNS